MVWDVLFFLNSFLLGIGLAMDAFSVSIANALNEPLMKKSRMTLIAGVYGFFQFSMPMLGWLCVHTIVYYFNAFEKFIPWIALLLLLYLGGKMIFESRSAKTQSQAEQKKLSFITLLLQGIATSIDALSVGFTIADYNFFMALAASLIIAVTTFIICFGGLIIGKKIGTRLNRKASLLGGLILILIGIEIFVKGIFF